MGVHTLVQNWSAVLQSSGRVQHSSLDVFDISSLGESYLKTVQFPKNWVIALTAPHIHFIATLHTSLLKDIVHPQFALLTMLLYKHIALPLQM